MTLYNVTLLPRCFLYKGFHDITYMYLTEEYLYNHVIVHVLRIGRIYICNKYSKARNQNRCYYQCFQFSPTVGICLGHNAADSSSSEDYWDTPLQLCINTGIITNIIVLSATLIKLN